MWLTFLKLGNICGIIWIVSIIVFISYVFWASDKGGIEPPFLIAIFLTGILAFLSMVLSYIIHALFKWKRKDKHIGKQLKHEKKPLLKRNVGPYALIGALILIAILSNRLGILGQATKNVEIKPTPKSEIVLPTSNQNPTVQPARAYVDPDPIVNCGPGQNSGQYVKDRSSNCKNYVDCGFSKNVWTMMLKTECDKKHADANPPCAVYGKTYYVSPETCKYYQQEEARTNSIGNSYTTQPSTNTVQPTQQPAVDYAAQNQKNIELRSQCLANVANYCQQLEADARGQCRALNLGDSSCQNLINAAKGQCSSLRSDCESRYPVY